MSFRDYDELVTRTPKQLPLGGQLFDFPDRISAEHGLLLLHLSRTAADLDGPTVESLIEAAGVTADQYLALQDEMLGDGHERLLAAGFGQAVQHVVQTLTAWHLYGQEAAEQTWNSLGPTSAPNRAARRSKAATATSTKPPASRAGSTSRTAAADRPGRSSSTSGR